MHSTSVLVAIVVISVPLSTLAWTGPTAAPPGNNVSAPINISAAEQFKPGIVGANIINIYGSSQYLSFGNTTGAGGFGLRNNGGVIELKHSSGSWSPLTANPWAQNGGNLLLTTGNVAIGNETPAAKLTVGAAGSANNAYYDIGADKIAANTSIYSYGRICSGNTAGNCLGTGGTALRSDGVQFPDGTLQTTASSASPSGTWCGYRVVDCVSSPGVPQYVGYATPYHGSSTSRACNGVTLASSCTYDPLTEGYYPSAITCPSGYTGNYQLVTAKHALTCIKN